MKAAVEVVEDEGDSAEVEPLACDNGHEEKKTKWVIQVLTINWVEAYFVAKEP